MKKNTLILYPAWRDTLFTPKLHFCLKINPRRFHFFLETTNIKNSNDRTWKQRVRKREHGFSSHKKNPGPAAGEKAPNPKGNTKIILPQSYFEVKMWWNWYCYATSIDKSRYSYVMSLLGISIVCFTCQICHWK